MTAPVPEETNAAYDLDEAPPGEHDSELPTAEDADGHGEAGGAQGSEENAETSLDQPSQ